MKSVPIYIFAAALAAASLHGASSGSRFETVYEYSNGYPIAFLALADAVYGVGGPSMTSCGQVFQVVPPAAPGADWALKSLHVFTGVGGSHDGCFPVGNLAAGSDGTLYGVTDTGGSGGAGTVYEVQPPPQPGGDWTETVLYSFPGVVATPFGVVVAPSGDLYVGADDLGPGYGAVLQLQPPASRGAPWTNDLAFSFPANTRRGYPTSLSLGADGAFYGTIDNGGNKGEYGAVFKLNRPGATAHHWTEDILYDFHGHADGAGPDSVFLGPDGLLYGTTFGTLRLDDTPGPAGATTVFTLAAPTTPGKWTKTILHSFNKDGWGGLEGITSPLIMYKGKLYGATGAPVFKHNGPGGFVFELTPPATLGGPWTTTILHRFSGGQIPYGPIAIDPNGSLFGGTYLNNANPSQGTIYRVKLP